jgi:DNA-directed RNA polymerase specialized sigma24 family protein
MQKLNTVSASEHIQALYRFLLIRTGQRIQAEHALRKTLTESPQDSHGNQDRMDFMKYYQTALKMPATSSKPAETDLAGWALALHHLPEPERSAITLFYLEIFSPRILSEILGLDIEELAQVIGTARKSLETQQTNSITP